MAVRRSGARHCEGFARCEPEKALLGMTRREAVEMIGNWVMGGSSSCEGLPEAIQKRPGSPSIEAMPFIFYESNCVTLFGTCGVALFIVRCTDPQRNPDRLWRVSLQLNSGRNPERSATTEDAQGGAAGSILKIQPKCRSGVFYPVWNACW